MLMPRRIWEIATKMALGLSGMLIKRSNCTCKHLYRTTLWLNLCLDAAMPKGSGWQKTTKKPLNSTNQPPNKTTRKPKTIWDSVTPKELVCSRIGIRHLNTTIALLHRDLTKL